MMITAKDVQAVFDFLLVTGVCAYVVSCVVSASTAETLAFALVLERITAGVATVINRT